MSTKESSEEIHGSGEKEKIMEAFSPSAVTANNMAVACGINIRISEDMSPHDYLEGLAQIMIAYNEWMLNIVKEDLIKKIDSCMKEKNYS